MHPADTSDLFIAGRTADSFDASEGASEGEPTVEAAQEATRGPEPVAVAAGSIRRLAQLGSRVAIGMSVLLVASVVRADHAAWISKADAERGAGVIKGTEEIRDYCLPCGDTSYAARKVGSVTVEQPDSSNWQVKVNGLGVDLAYEYVLVRGQWKNLAMLLGLPVTGVPAELPATLPNGGLTTELAISTVREYQPRLAGCYNAALATKPTLRGLVKVKVGVGQDGGVADAQDAGSTLPDPSVVQCVLGRFRTLIFPKPNRDDATTLVVPLQFVPPSATPSH